MTDKHHPTAEERAEIIARREALTAELVEHLMLFSQESPQEELDELFNTIVQKYGRDEVNRRMTQIEHQLTGPNNPQAHALQRYREYAMYYRRFGGDRTFLDQEAFARLSAERADLLKILLIDGETLSDEDQQRLDELSSAILAEADMWEDLVPENPPPPTHPVYAIDLSGKLSTGAKKQGRRSHKKIGRNEPCWCGSGKKYKHCHLNADAQQA